MSTNIGDFGAVTVGRLTLRESLDKIDESSTGQDIRSTSLTGQDASPPNSSALVHAFQDDIAGLAGELVPITFTNKADRNGYYMVMAGKPSITNITSSVIQCDWAIDINRIGSDNEIDLESRITGSVIRTNSFGATGERWHAPPVSGYGWTTSGTLPTTMTRNTTEGSITVYRGIAAGTNPRWGCPVAGYGGGRCRVLDANGFERTGRDWSPSPSSWEANNGLVKVTPGLSGGSFTISAYTGAAWQAKEWDFVLAGTPIAAFTSMSVLRNAYEQVVIRLMYAQNPGRTTVDISLRRGSRFAEFYVQTGVSATLGLVRHAAEAGTDSGTGWLNATSLDAANNEYIIGSTRAYTPDATNGGISVTGLVFDAFIGVLAGMSPVSGDTGADLYNQYMVGPNELVQGVRR